MKNKTVAAWLAFLGGPLGMHRFYLYGLGDWIGWLLPIPTALGVYGIQRVQQWGQDDQLSWMLIPLLGFTIAGCALRAILYGLMTPERWNARFNPASTCSVAGASSGANQAPHTTASMAITATALRKVNRGWDQVCIQATVRRSASSTLSNK